MLERSGRTASTGKDWVCEVPSSPWSATQWGGLLSSSRRPTATSAYEETGRLSVAHVCDQAAKVFYAVGFDTSPPLAPPQAAAGRPGSGSPPSPPPPPRRPEGAEEPTPRKSRASTSHGDRAARALEQVLKSSPASRLQASSEGKRKPDEARANLAALAGDFCTVGHLVRARGRHLGAAAAPTELPMVGALPRASPRMPRTKVQAKRFEAKLCSFQELVNAEHTPTPLSEALERLRSVVGGPNFVWKKVDGYGDRYGGAVDISYELILWYENIGGDADLKTHISTGISFMHVPGVAYIYQPVVPVVSLIISPKTSMRPMFEMDARSFHTFKLAWRRLLDFGVSDYRVVVGEQLERWTSRFKQVIERPLNATYWLMFMVGSYYREVLVQRRVLDPILEPPKTVPVICVDSFVALSTLLFAPERQVLFAGIDPTPSYLEWLQYIGDQSASRKMTVQRRHSSSPGCTVFEANETLDVAVIIVYYGRIQQKVKESTPLSWVANPPLIKLYISKYMEDNRCSEQFEHAVRLYTKSCAIGRQRDGDDPDSDKWYCWNGLNVCEVGVPMPSTFSTFLSPFVVTRPAALHCQVHGPDGLKRRKEDASRKSKKDVQDGDNVGRQSSESSPRPRRAASGVLDEEESPDTNSNLGTRRHGGSVSLPQHAERSRSASRISRISADQDTDSRLHSDTEDDSDESSSSTSTGGGADDRSQEERSTKMCVCKRYIPPPTEAQRQRARRRRQQGSGGPGGGVRTGQQNDEEELEERFRALGDYDTLHAFSAVLAGGLNLGKHFVRLHFGLDPKAYEHLPGGTKVDWQETMIPWYREFHRPDVYGRSRYTMLLERVVSGLLGDGFTSGVLVDSLDLLRVAGQEPREELSEKDLSTDPKIGGDKAPNAEFFAGKKSTFHPGPQGRRNSGMQPHGGGGTGGGHAGSMLQGSPAQGGSGGGDFNSEPTAPVRAKQTGIVTDIALLAELHECESFYSHRTHFDSFTQWCHSANLVPFLQRCYRRCGIAGLLPGAESGGHKYGADPSHPLVLPTMSDFHYGHCYPIHRVIQYFYGGVEHIMCSIDDPQAVEADRAALGLTSAQDKAVNRMCWFTPSLADLADGAQRTGPDGGALTNNLLQQLQDFYAAAPTAKALAAPRSLSEARRTVVPSRHSSRPASPTAELRGSTVMAGGRPSAIAPVRTGSRVTGGALVSRKSQSRVQRNAPKRRSRRREPPGSRLGLLVPTDPFFWFCSQNYGFFAYPVQNIPRQLLADPGNIQFRYNDFHSRSGTPEPVAVPEQDPELEDGDGLAGFRIPDRTRAIPPPPSINVCQPTDLRASLRQRWEVKKEFVDRCGLILGDSGWWPGASGHRFTYEARCDKPDRFTKLSVVPLAHLLYIEHAVLPSRAEARRLKALRQAGKRASSAPWYASSSSSSSSSEGAEQDEEPEPPGGAAAAAAIPPSAAGGGGGGGGVATAAVAMAAALPSGGGGSGTGGSTARASALERRRRKVEARHGSAELGEPLGRLAGGTGGIGSEGCFELMLPPLLRAKLL